MKSELKFYLSIFWKRAHIFLLVLVAMSAAAIAVAMLAPTKYVADALLLMETPSIDPELASSTVQFNPAEQLEIIEKRLFARDNLLEVADKVGVFENRGEMFVDEVVEQMERRTSFSKSTGRDRATLFTVMFEAGDARIAAAVASEYVTRIMAENLKLRTETSGQTLEFFDDQVEDLSEELSKQSALILEFKNANIDALPDTLDYRLNRQSDLQERVSDIDRELADLDDQREVYKKLLASGQFSTGNRTEEQIQLDNLKTELSNALATLSDQNPRVKLLKARIDALDSTVRKQLAAQGFDESVNPETVQLDLEIASIDSKAKALNQQRQSAVDELAEIERTLKLTPTNAIALEALERDYANIEMQYNLAESKLAEARQGNIIEIQSKGQKISVIRQPIVPREPASPNRPLIAVGGIALGSAAGVALIALLELLNRSIRRPADLTNALGIVPLATLPFVRTQQEVVFRRSVIAFFMALLAVGVPLGLYLVHVYVLPLELLFDQLTSRFGLS